MQGGSPAGVRLRTGPFARSLTRVLSAEAVTLGRLVFLSRPAARQISAGTEDGLRLLRHELAHVAQFARDGTARFLWSYAVSYARGRRRGLPHGAAYSEIPYEREACAAEREGESLSPAGFPVYLRRGA